MSVGEDVHCEFVKEKYTPEYRQKAARLVIESGRPFAHVAKELGVAEGLLGKWVKLERPRQGSADGRSDSDIRAENARLRRELAEAKRVNWVFVKSHRLLRGVATRSEKFELIQPDQGELQHKENEQAIAGFPF